MQKNKQIEDNRIFKYFGSDSTLDRWTLVYHGVEYSIPTEEATIEAVLQGIYRVINKKPSSL